MPETPVCQSKTRSIPLNPLKSLQSTLHFCESNQ